jgi:hypothetical protein
MWAEHEFCASQQREMAARRLQNDKRPAPSTAGNQQNMKNYTFKPDRLVIFLNKYLSPRST